ncbi:MAG TPA: hypothetical protein VK189_07575 [Thermoplasmata archaeon]|nr:hypothetical protein [Thermoplasmata archaeon]
MLSLSKGRRFEHGLSFLATLAFLGGFFGARLFHLAFPSLMIITSQGIHFHHFWYGLTMMGVAGWLGIVDNDEKFARVYAVVFGVGAGFVGDEVGLLLTGDDYYSELTFEFLIAALAFIILVALMIRYRKQILEEVFQLSRGERLTHVGVFLIGFSAIMFAFDALELGVPLIVLGAALFAWGYRRDHGAVRKSGPGA